MDLSKQHVRSIPKPQFKRNKPTAKQRGEVTAKVRKELHARSGGVCERCYRAKAVQAAHCIRRWKVEGRTTVQDLVHLCVECHLYADNTRAGRIFLEQFRQIRLQEQQDSIS